jgi:helix-turn-helix protein
MGIEREDHAKARRPPLAVSLADDCLCTFGSVAVDLGLLRPDMANAWYRFAIAAREPGPLAAASGIRIAVSAGRTFLRRFEASTGTTPGAWLTTARGTARARELLASSHRPIEEIATEAGFGSAAMLRHQHLSVYRRRFSLAA